MATVSTEIPRTMQALRCYGTRDYRLEEIPTPKPGPGELLVRVRDCGICASDIKCFTGASHFWGDAHRPPYVETPVTPGHEFSGVVVGMGEGAAERHRVAIGDTVVAEQIVPCEDCRYCSRGMYWLCVKAQVFGFKHAVEGGMAEYMIYPRNSRVYKVPESVSARRASLIEPLGCAIHAVERGGIRLGDVVVQVGCGTLGLCMVAAERLKNPGLLIALDLVDARLNLARKFGADITINPAKEDALARVLELTEGYGCDVLIEATGNPDAIVPGLHMVRKAGTFVEFSVMRGDSPADWTIIGDGKELNVLGAHLAPYTFPTAIDYLARGVIEIDDIVTHELPLAEHARGFATVEKPSEAVKVLLQP